MFVCGDLLGVLHTALCPLQGNRKELESIKCLLAILVGQGILNTLLVCVTLIKRFLAVIHVPTCSPGRHSHIFYRKALPQACLTRLGMRSRHRVHLGII